ncbi:MAG: phosphotransferase [Proteobacteria bacterium]|nr:phosphotransferase [Pseudomonadota bacterium]MDA1063625.1 phosphotransferase [Pseudomonadota bacterium]
MTGLGEAVDNDLEPIYTSAVWKALERFPVDVESIEFVEHSENVTFRIRACDRASTYVLRLHRPGYNSGQELKSERDWIVALNNAGVSVPSPVVSHDGTHFVLVDIPEAGEQRYVGVTSWIEGAPLRDYLATVSSKKERERLFHGIGEIAAAIHNQSANWKGPPGFMRPCLDIDGLLGESPRWGRFWEHAELSGGEKELLLRARTNLRAALTTYGSEHDKFSLIHSDLDPDNIIYASGGLSLIDFDDSAYGWHMYDIASALIEYCSAPDFAALCTALLEGYREHRPLESRDVEMLPAFLLIRGMAIIGWYHQRPEHAGSEGIDNVKNWTLMQCKAMQL